MIMSNDSFDATEVPEGLLITEKKKGALKMLLVFVGMSILMILLAILLALTVGNTTFVQIIAPVLFWGGILVGLVTVIGVIVKFSQNRDPKILFNKTTSTLYMRGKEIPFTDISRVVFQSQDMLGKTATFIFLMVNDKKKTLFTTSVVTKDVQGMQNLKERIEEMVLN